MPHHDVHPHKVRRHGWPPFSGYHWVYWPWRLTFPGLLAFDVLRLVLAGVKFVGSGGVTETVILLPKLGTKYGYLTVVDRLLCGLTIGNR
jgi:hypothetical protein